MWQRSDGAILCVRTKIIARIEPPAAHEYETKLFTKELDCKLQSTPG